MITPSERLPFNASTGEDVSQYYHTRSLQLALNGYKWSRAVSQYEGGCITHFTDSNGVEYDSFYVFADYRKAGVGKRLASKCEHPIITIDDCNVTEYLQHLGLRYKVEHGPYNFDEYKMIERFYGSQRAKRSGVLLMNHIDEGLYILRLLGASFNAMRAFCLHPLLQADKDLEANFDDVVTKTTPTVIALTMEYRNIANQWLSDKVSLSDSLAPHIVYETPPPTSPLYGVMQMLRADKIQNYKDFLQYHSNTHERRVEYDAYFVKWLKHLAVEDSFPLWVRLLNELNPPPIVNPL